MAETKTKIMFVVGEASGDSHAAKLADSLRTESPETDFEMFGATGAKMRAAGVETTVEADQFGIVGVPEVARALPMFWGVFRKLKKEAQIREPDVVVLVDFPEFNLKLAKALKKLGFRVVYYISPQLWAWRKYRIKTIREDIDLLLAILPFEKDWYAKKGVTNVEYVGNPSAGEVKPDLTREQFCEKFDLDPAKPIVGLLPGSRRKETSRMLPILIETASLMAKKENNLQFVVALASNRGEKDVDDALEEMRKRGVRAPANFIAVRGKTYDVLNAADAAAVTSGTATMEAAIIETPLTIIYKTSALNGFIFRPFISTEHIGLVNLIAEERLAKELIQDGLTAERLSRELFRLLTPKINNEMRKKLAEVNESLGEGGASKRAAKAILSVLEH